MQDAKYGNNTRARISASELQFKQESLVNNNFLVLCTQKWEYY